jgi:hypothetical protein
VVCFLIAGCESPENKNVFRRDLVQTTTFEANPVCVLFDPQIKRLPMGPSSNVEFFDKICPLATVETSNHVQSRVVKCNRGVEVPSCVERSDLSPGVRCHIIHFTFVHRLTGQTWADRIDLASVPIRKHRCECVCPPFKDHISSLNQALINKLISTLRCLSRLTPAC